MDIMFLAFLALMQSVLIGAVIVVPAAWVFDRMGDEILALSAGLVVFACAGWFCFFFYWAHPYLGLAYKLCLFSLLIFALRKLWIDGRLRQPIWINLAPAFFVVPATLIITLWAFIGTDLSDPLITAASRWTHDLPIDNSLPFIMAQYLRDGAVPSPMIGDWLGSDRPPLQSGLYLLFGHPDIFSNDLLLYQVSGTAIQLTALTGVYLLARSLGVDRKLSVAAVLAVFFSPLALQHATYVWPKLLPAGLLCVTAGLYFTPSFPRYRDRVLPALLAGGAAAMALGGHGASAFMLVGFAGYALLSHRFPTFKFLAVASVTFILLELPWSAYQHYVDPPGDRLLKWHVAGDVGPNELSFSEALAVSLHEVRMWDWYQARKANFDTLFGSQELMNQYYTGLLEPPAGHERSEYAQDIRIQQFFHTKPSMGVFMMGLVLVPLFLFFGALRGLAGAVIVGLSAWCLLMFEPASTVVHQGSFFPQLALITLSVIGLSKVHWGLAFVGVAAQLIWAIIIFGVFG